MKMIEVAHILYIHMYIGVGVVGPIQSACMGARTGIIPGAALRHSIRNSDAKLYCSPRGIHVCSIFSS